MKKILSLALAGVMMVSALPVAYAADTQDYNLGTTVSVEGTAASEYEVKVPARLDAGTTGNVVATGTWKSYETLIVTADTEIEVTSKETGKTTMVPVKFDGINATGNDLAAMNISKEVKVEKGDILFGTWTGIVNYNVDLQVEEIDFTIDGTSYKAEYAMTYRQWVDSEYNTIGATIVQNGTSSQYLVKTSEGRIFMHSGSFIAPDATITDGFAVVLSKP